MKSTSRRTAKSSSGGAKRRNPKPHTVGTAKKRSGSATALKVKGTAKKAAKAAAVAAGLAAVETVLTELSPRGKKRGVEDRKAQQNQ
jgi:hypothetical protein